MSHGRFYQEGELQLLVLENNWNTESIRLADGTLRWSPRSPPSGVFHTLRHLPSPSVKRTLTRKGRRSHVRFRTIERILQLYLRPQVCWILDQI